MSNSHLSTGDPVLARCTKCKKNTDHLVVSMAAVEPEKVQCSVCERKHKFRLPIEAKKPAVKRVPAHIETEQKEWQALCQNVDNKKVSDYSMTASFKPRTVISHPVFGLGLVQRASGSQKVEILFESGKKTMRCL